ncbi:MAG: DUF349 domain-containing protein [Propionibacteriaceae bacterium]|nr:DUF349 domain-containing protein [Propionibacteriaceae bacterium]
MSENPETAGFGRVDDDGTVYVRVGETERAVGQIPDATPEQALAFFVRRGESLGVEVDLLSQRVKNGALSPEEARKSIAHLRDNIIGANAVADLEGLAARLDPLQSLIDQQSASRQAAKAELTQATKERKSAMVEQAEQIAAGSDWTGGWQKFRDLLDEWKTLPHLDKKTDDEMWHQFSSARTTFTRRRKAHFAERSAIQDQARVAKEAIIAEAESLADSTDWGQTAGQFRDLMTRWKAAGGAGRQVDDQLWSKFRAIQDNFFNRRSEVFSAQDQENQGNLTIKQELLDKAESEILPVKDVAAARSAYREFITAFNAVGRVPADKSRSIDARVRALESAIDEADRREWARTDPQTRSRAAETVNLFSGQIDKLKKSLAKAEQSGDKGQISKLTSSLATYQTWLDQAQSTLDDLKR